MDSIPCIILGTYLYLTVNWKVIRGKLEKMHMKWCVFPEPYLCLRAL